MLLLLHFLRNYAPLIKQSMGFISQKPFHLPNPMQIPFCKNEVFFTGKKKKKNISRQLSYKEFSPLKSMKSMVFISQKSSSSQSHAIMQIPFHLSTLHNHLFLSIFIIFMIKFFPSKCTLSYQTLLLWPCKRHAIFLFSFANILLFKEFFFFFHKCMVG